MVKHVVMWELKDKETKAEVGAEMKKRLEALVGVVPGLLKAEVNTGFAGADVILYTCLLYTSMRPAPASCAPARR